MTQQDRLTLRNICSQTKYSKIVITHGTDTMIHSAKVLGQHNIKGKTIVVTGAMRPQRFSNSDAAFNIGVALGTLSTSKQGVYVAMNGLSREWNKVQRCLKTGKFIAK